MTTATLSESAKPTEISSLKQRKIDDLIQVDRAALSKFTRIPNLNFVIVVEDVQDWQPRSENEQVITATDYLGKDALFATTGITIINLCRSYKYLSIGYYCSLLAEARSQQVIPSIKSINDLSHKSIYSLDMNEFDYVLNESFSKHKNMPMPAEFAMDIFFGKTDFTPLAKVAQHLFNLYPVPLLRVEFEHKDNWKIRAVKIQPITSLYAYQEEHFAATFKAFHAKAWHMGNANKKHHYHIAILHDPDESLPPSNTVALEKFVQIGRELDIDVTLIEKKHYSHIAEYDALLIRETTAINHHTYRFAKKAESEGLVVIDDPVSILRCTNKIYLADLMRINQIPTPRTYVLQENDISRIDQLESEIGYPMVMKIPDGAFSTGVSKVSNRNEFETTAQELLNHSSLILVQEYLYTEFDWRIGVLNKKPIFASKYYMSTGHWQVAKRDAEGKAEFGMSRAVALDQVPPHLLDQAVKAANLIGDSLYGVDMKMTERGPVVIEVNDNPNIDQGIEDGVLGDELYRLILLEIIRRLRAQHAENKTEKQAAEF